MTKQISSEVMCEYDVVVVCCKKCKKRETKEFWKSRDYSIHSVSHRSKTFDKQLCKILFQSDQNMPIRQSVLLQFNARKHNYIQIQIKCEQNSLSEVLSNIEIQKLFINSFNHSTPGDFIVKMKHAHRKHKPDSSASHRIGSNETNTAALVTQKTTTWREDLYCQGVIQEEFLNDNLLACILDEIKDMWAAVLILIGVSFNLIETKMMKMKDANTNDNIRFKLFRQWRDGNSHKEDKGIPELLSSVIKCGKLSCCNYIRRCLKLWREQHFSADVSFVSWIERAYADSNMFMPTIYPRPMSDQYLVLLCECLKPTPDLAHALNISHQDYESIIQSHLYIDDMMKLLKIFMIFRERQEDLADALQYLLDCLYNLGYKDQWSRGVACINGWLNRHAEVTDSLRDPIKKLLARINSNKRSPRLLLKRWNTAHVGVFSGLSFSRQRSATASQSNSRLKTSTMKPHRSLYSFVP